MREEKTEIPSCGYNVESSCVRAYARIRTVRWISYHRHSEVTPITLSSLWDNDTITPLRSSFMLRCGCVYQVSARDMRSPCSALVQVCVVHLLRLSVGYGGRYARVEREVEQCDA